MSRMTTEERLTAIEFAIADLRSQQEADDIDLVDLIDEQQLTDQRIAELVSRIEMLEQNDEPVAVLRNVLAKVIQQVDALQQQVERLSGE